MGHLNVIGLCDHGRIVNQHWSKSKGRYQVQDFAVIAMISKKRKGCVNKCR